MKDIWDKLGVIGTFLSSTLIVIFTTFITYQTSVLTNRVETFQKKIDENKMISELVTNLSDSASSTLKIDFALLALERYMRHSNENSELCLQDKEMLTGFAESIILNYNNADQLRPLELQLKIAKDFLFRYQDTTKWNNIVNVIYPKTELNLNLAKVNVTDVVNFKPVSTVSDTIKSALITSILKKIVHIQYKESFGKGKAESMKEMFSANEWAAPGVEQVEGKYDNIIKYFHPEDRMYADQANKMLNEKFKVINAVSNKYQKQVPKGQIEIWASFATNN